jgi:hypothetical protein
MRKVFALAVLPALVLTAAIASAQSTTPWDGFYLGASLGGEHEILQQLSSDRPEHRSGEFNYHSLQQRGTGGWIAIWRKLSNQKIGVGNRRGFGHLGSQE